MMTLDGLNEDFRDVVILLADAGADFMIIGAYALAFHGAPRASDDIDLFVRAANANAGRVFAALEKFGAPLDAQGVTAADLARQGTVYREAFIKNKIASGRPEDLADVARLSRRG